MRALCLWIVVCLSTPCWSATSSCKFKRGDSNGDGTVQISDAQHLWAYAFQGGPAPPNKDAADANDDGYINGTDSNYITLYLFGGGAAPPDPGPTTADCDPTSWDTLESACTPPNGMTVTALSATPTTIGGSTAGWDCNTSTVHAGDPKKVDIYSANTEATEAASCPQGTKTDELTLNLCCNRGHSACNHSITETRWTFVWTVVDASYVERLAFNTGCTKARIQLHWQADFSTGGPCGQAGGGCPGGDDFMRWKPDNAVMEVTFRNYTTLGTHTQNISWVDAFTSVTAISSPLGGYPDCDGLVLTYAPGSRQASRNIYVETVGWSGNDEWKLEEIKVKFLRVFDRATSADNSDEEIIDKFDSEWSLRLQTLQYQNL